MVGVSKDAGISVDVSFLRVFEGYCELGPVPLRIFGCVNEKVPSFGVVLQ